MIGPITAPFPCHVRFLDPSTPPCPRGCPHGALPEPARSAEAKVPRVLLRGRGRSRASWRPCRPGTSRGCAPPSSARSAWPSTGARWSRRRAPPATGPSSTPVTKAARARVSIMAVLRRFPVVGRRRPGVRTHHRGRAPRLHPLRERRGEALRPWRQLLAHPPQAPARPSPPTRSGTSPTTRRTGPAVPPSAARVRRLPKQQADRDPPRRQQGHDHHRRPPCQLDPRPARVRYLNDLYKMPGIKRTSTPSRSTRTRRTRAG